MKTKLLILTALVFAVLTFTSCSKDDSFTDVSPQTNSASSDIINFSDTTGLEKHVIYFDSDPISNKTIINYIIRESAMVNLEVFGINYALVADLVNEELLEPGHYSVEFDTKGLPDGIYNVKMSLTSDQILVVHTRELIKNDQ